MMKAILVLAMLAPLSATAAPAGDVGYVNMTKAIRDTAEGKKAFAEIEDVTRQHQVDVNAAITAAQAAAAKCTTLNGPAKAPCDKGAQKANADAVNLVDRLKADIVQRQNAADHRVESRALRILPTIATAHKLLLIQPADAALYIAPKADFTAELVKRYDAGEGKTDEAVASELRQKNAALESEKTAANKRADELAAKVAALEKAATKAPAGKN